MRPAPRAVFLPNEGKLVAIETSQLEARVPAHPARRFARRRQRRRPGVTLLR
jgi:hypothetical protein